MLMQGVLEGRLAANERFLGHIDLCLSCRACETVCPNHVPYGRLIAGMRGVIEKARRDSLWRRLVRRTLVDGVVTRPAMLRLVSTMMRAWQVSGLQAMAGKLSGLRFFGLTRIALQLPLMKAQPRWKTVYPPLGDVRGEVGLFLGCVARVSDVETLSASIFVLNKLGYRVHLPPDQSCCGALHESLGETQKACSFEQKNINAFAGLKLDAVISTATGCGATLKSYLPAFADMVMDISEFLAVARGWEEAAIAPLAQKVAVHEPCSMRNALRCHSRPYDLLSRIPGIAIEPLAGNDQCCGAAGTYFLSQPKMAKALLADKTAAAKVSGARLLVSSNIGCAMHMAGGLREAGIEIEVIHPVTLLARQMGFDGR